MSAPSGLAAAPPAAATQTGNRTGAKMIDLGLLVGAGLWLLAFQLELGLPAAGWLTLVWLIVVGPFYFGLYHGTGAGATPGERELALGMRAPDGERASFLRSLVHAYLGLVVPLPALVDRLTKISVLPVETASALPPVWAPTIAELQEIFEPVQPGDVWRRTRRLMRLHGRRLMRSVLLVYLGLVGVAAVLAPLFITDFNGGDFGSAAQITFWTVIASALYGSGIFWKQAAIAVAVEAVRAGEPAGPFEVLRRATRRANGLTVAFTLLAVMLSIASLFTMLLGLGLLLMALILARFIFVIPAITIEDRHVLAGFRRSAELTKGRRRQIVWRIAISAIVTVLIVWLGALVGISVVAGVLGSGGTVRLVYGAALGLAIASLPVSWALTNIGAYWALYHHDLRRAIEAKN